MKTKKLKFKTVILSDIHLGTRFCKVDEVIDFLKHVQCEKLILNGDIIDGWSLARRGGWTRKHTKFVRLVLKMVEKNRTEVIYLRGNHDEILGKLRSMAFGSLRIVEEHIHKTKKGNYLVVHGDCFDTITKNYKVLALAGDIGYQSLLRLNRYYNLYLRWRGKEYFSLSKYIKAKVKHAVSFISRFETHLEKLATKRECSGIICGHIHSPDNKMINNIHYLNSGDWVESMTAIVEREEGEFEVIEYQKFKKQFEDFADVFTPPPLEAVSLTSLSSTG